MTADPITIDFRAGGNSLPHADTGWASPDPEGRWSESVEAAMRIRLDPLRCYRLDLDAVPFLTPAQPAQRVILAARGRILFAAGMTTPRRWACRAASRGWSLRRRWRDGEGRLHRPFRAVHAWMRRQIGARCCWYFGWLFHRGGVWRH